jgi:hypothetical protein
MSPYDQHSVQKAIQAHEQKPAARRLTCAPFRLPGSKLVRIGAGRGVSLIKHDSHTLSILQSEIDCSIAVYLSVALSAKFLRRFAHVGVSFRRDL